MKRRTFLQSLGGLAALIPFGALLSKRQKVVTPAEPTAVCMMGDLGYPDDVIVLDEENTPDWRENPNFRRWCEEVVWYDAHRQQYGRFINRQWVPVTDVKLAGDMLIIHG